MVKNNATRAIIDDKGRVSEAIKDPEGVVVENYRNKQGVVTNLYLYKEAGHAVDLRLFRVCNEKFDNDMRWFWFKEEDLELVEACS